MKKTSLVLSTYNGAKYLVEQLNSIRLQTKPLDEVLILDDCSTDDTPHIISNYIEEFHLDASWRFLVNESNIGWKKNFMKGFKMVSGDIIFSSDQDDIWMVDKIEKMLDVFESNLDITLLSCNLLPLYEENVPHNLHPMFIRPYGKNRVEKITPDKLFLVPIRPGCTYGFRKELLDKVLEVWYPEWAHDCALHTVSLITDGYYNLNEPLIQFRRHGANNSPVINRTPKGRTCQAQDSLRRLNLISVREESWNISGCNRILIEKAKEYYKAKIDFFRNRSLRGCISYLKFYRYYPDLRSLIGDYYIKFCC